MKFMTRMVVGFVVLCFQLVLAQDKGGRWQFEKNGFDSAEWDAISDDGSIQGVVVYDSSDARQGFYYLSIDTSTSNSYMRIEDSDDLDFTNEDIAISAWIYPFIINDVHYILNKGDNNAQSRTTNYSLRISRDGFLEFLIRNTSNQAQRTTSSFRVATNQWIFAGVFYDYDAQKVYIWNDPESNPVDTVDFNVDFASNDDPLAIGTWYSTAQGGTTVKDFKGRIDDVRISTRINDILVSSIPASHRALPVRLELDQNYPNPFNSSTTIRFRLAKTQHVDLKIYDIMGNEVATLIDRELRPGEHQLVFNADHLATGMYYYRINTAIRKMILLK